MKTTAGKAIWLGAMLCAVIAAAVLSALLYTPSEAVSLPQTAEVFLVDRHVNYAWGYMDNGLFIDTTGAVYGFQFGTGMYTYGTSAAQMQQKFDIIRTYTEPVIMLDENTVMKLYTLGMQIDPESKFRTKNVAMDAGTDTISFCAPDTKALIVCTERGDNKGDLQDSAARQFVRLYQKAIRNLPPDYTAPLFFTADEVPMCSIACDTKISGKFFLDSAAELRMFAAQLRVPIDGLLDGYADDEQEWYVYFVELNAAPSNAVMRTGESYQLIHTDGVGFCNVAAFPRTNGTFLSETIPCTDGGVWQRMQNTDS